MLSIGEEYFESEVGKDAAESICSALYRNGIRDSKEGFNIDTLYNASEIRKLYPDDPSVEKMITDFDSKHAGKTNLIMKVFFDHFDYDYGSAGRKRLNQNKIPDRELDRRECALLHFRNSKILGLYKEYSPGEIRKAVRIKGSFDKMIADFDSKHAGKTNLIMKDFFDYFGYKYKEDSSVKQYIGGVSDFVNKILPSLKLTDKNSICFYLSKKKRFSPEMEYNKKDIKPIFTIEKITKQLPILDKFEENHINQENLTMQDFYNFNNFKYKYSFSRKLSKVVGGFILEVNDRIEKIQRSSGEGLLNIGSKDTKSLYSYLVALSIGLYIPLINISDGYNSHPEYQDTLDQYSLNIDNIYDIGRSIIDIDSLTSFRHENFSTEDMRAFDLILISLMDDLKGINLDSTRSESIAVEVEIILKKHTNLLDTEYEKVLADLRGSPFPQKINILTLIERIGEGNAKLDSLKMSLLSLHELLIQENMKNPIDNIFKNNTILFWKDEDELGKLKQQEDGELFEPETPDIKLT